MGHHQDELSSGRISIGDLKKGKKIIPHIHGLVQQDTLHSGIAWRIAWEQRSFALSSAQHSDIGGLTTGLQDYLVASPAQQYLLIHDGLYCIGMDRERELPDGQHSRQRWDDGLDDDSGVGGLRCIDLVVDLTVYFE